MPRPSHIRIDVFVASCLSNLGFLCNLFRAMTQRDVPLQAVILLLVL